MEYQPPYLLVPNPKPKEITEQWLFQEGSEFVAAWGIDAGYFNLGSPPLPGEFIQLAAWDNEKMAYMPAWFRVITRRKSIMPGPLNSLLNETLFIVRRVDPLIELLDEVI